MTLSQALELLKNCAASLNAKYGKVVFNEWAIISLRPGQERMLSYLGPRKEDFQKNFVQDLGSLRAELLTTRHTPGYFDFSRQAVGTSFEAFVCVGTELYLICNNTEDSMEQITGDSRWLDAQKHFAEMTDRFQAEPLAV